MANNQPVAYNAQKTSSKRILSMTELDDSEPGGSL